MSDAGVDDGGRVPVPPALCEYAAEMTAQRLDKMISHIDGVRKAEDIESVHQMRVWSRRSRAALEMFRVCFTGRAFAEVEREVRATTDALGEARDLDVMMDSLQKRAEKLPASQRAGVESFVQELRKTREEGQQAVAKAVTDLESHNLAQHFRDLVAKANTGRVADASAKSRRTDKKAGVKGKQGGRKGRQSNG